MRNCDEETNKMFHVAGLPLLNRCPWSVIDAQASSIVNRWSEWRALGVLPYDGEIGDQPAWLVDGFEACEAAIGDARSEQAKRAAQTPTAPSVSAPRPRARRRRR